MQLKLSWKTNRTRRIERPNDRTKYRKKEKSRKKCKKLKPNDKGGLQTLIKLIQKGKVTQTKTTQQL